MVLNGTVEKKLTKKNAKLEVMVKKFLEEKTPLELSLYASRKSLIRYIVKRSVASKHNTF